MRKGFLPPLVQINILKDLPIHHTLTFEKSEMLKINKRISGISSKQERKGVGGSNKRGERNFKVFRFKCKKAF